MAAVRELKFPVTDPDAGEVSALYLNPPKATCLYVFAHGAGAPMTHPFMTAAANELAAMGIATFRYNFPYMEKRRGAPDRPPMLTATVRAAVKIAAKCAPKLPIFAGGKSMGGRMTSQAVAEANEKSGLPNADALEKLRGLIFFGFPLHPPKQPATKRAEHLKNVKVPMLFLQGTRDDLADLKLLAPICKDLGNLATLHIIDGADHSFHVLKSSGTSDTAVLSGLGETVKSWTTQILSQKN
jgi:uncharacterized protein